MAAYEALDFFKFETRLLQLLPPATKNSSSSEGDIVRCTLLQHVSLLGPPEYHALSYCWNQGEGSRCILVDNREVEVKANLESALRELRSGIKGCDLIWADALCINQSDLYEKSYQISRMGQIYASAALVIAWAGPATSAALSVHDRLGVCDDADISVSTLSRSPFWARAWIVQELSRGIKVEVMWEPQSFSWTVLVEMCKRTSDGLVTLDSATPLVPLSDLVSTLNRFRSRELDDPFGSQRLTLLHALVETRYFMATDTRDKIYALLGITFDGPSLVPMPNYVSSIRDVLMQSAHRIIVGQQQISAMLLASRARYADPYVPSWVPNWAILGQRRVPPWILRSIACSKAYTTIKVATTSDQALRMPIKNIVQIEEVFASTAEIRRNSNCLLPGVSDSGLVGRLFEVFQGSQLWNHVHSSTEHLYLSIVDKVNLRGRIFAFTRAMLNGGHVTGAGSDLNLASKWWMANQSLKVCGKTLREVFENVNREMEPRLLDIKPPTDDGQVVEAMSRILEWLEQNSMIIALTSPGEPIFRLVHDAARSGDWICALPNCPLPVVLRRLRFPPGSNNARRSSYHFIGEVYSEQMAARSIQPFNKDLFRYGTLRLRQIQGLEAQLMTQDREPLHPWPSIWEVEG